MRGAVLAAGDGGETRAVPSGSPAAERRVGEGTTMKNEQTSGIVVKSPTREVNGLCSLDEAGVAGGGTEPAETRGWGGAGVRVSVAGTVFRELDQ